MARERGHRGSTELMDELRRSVHQQQQSPDPSDRPPPVPEESPEPWPPPAATYDRPAGRTAGLSEEEAALQVGWMTFTAFNMSALPCLGITAASCVACRLRSQTWKPG